ncbi:MAG: hypothetical protein AAGG50_16495 [Bacteroidota bacterium]
MAVVTTDVAKAILEEHLVGRWYAMVEIGDWWRLAFNDSIWLVAQRLTVPEEADLRSHLETSPHMLLDGIDPEDIPIAVAVLRNRHRRVRSVDLSPDGTLVIHFENEATLLCLSSAPATDWQWAINLTGVDPYNDYTVACFRPEEIHAL